LVRPPPSAFCRRRPHLHSQHHARRCRRPSLVLTTTTLCDRSLLSHKHSFLYTCEPSPFCAVQREPSPFRAGRGRGRGGGGGRAWLTFWGETKFDKGSNHSRLHATLFFFLAPKSNKVGGMCVQTASTVLGGCVLV
jgi:hypothetical protein